MKSFFELKEKIQKDKDDPCWKDYVQLGTKKKNGKEVPNCVPKESDVQEKAVSQSQQKMMGMALAYKRGEMDDASPEVKKMANSMSTKDLEDFAKTKHKGLPDKKEGVEENRYSPLQQIRKKKEAEDRKKKDGTSDSQYQRMKKKQYGGMMVGLKKEEVELGEMFASTVDAHKDGYRPKVVKDGNKLSYLGQHAYKSKEHARNAADHIANAHRKGKASDSYIQDFARRHHKEHGMKESMDLDEAGSPERLAMIKRATQRVKDKKKAARDAEKKASFRTAVRDMQTRGAQRGMAPVKMESVDLDEGRNDARKALMSLAKQGGIDKATFQKAYDLYSDTKFVELKKLISGADTDPREAILDVIKRHDSRAFNSMYPRGLSKGGLTKESTDLGEAGYSVPSNYAALMLKKRKQQQKAAAKEKWGKDDAEYLKKNTQKEEVELGEGFFDRLKSAPHVAKAGVAANKGDLQAVKGHVSNAVPNRITGDDREKQMKKHYANISKATKNTSMKAILKKMSESAELDEKSRSFPFQGSNDHAPKNIFQPPFGSRKNMGQVTFLDKSGKEYSPTSSKNKKKVKENEELGEVKIPNNYAAMMAKKRKKAGTSEFGSHPDKKVKDRKTGKMYDPDKEFEKLKNSPEFKDQMKRMAKRDAVGESVELGEVKVKNSDAAMDLEKEISALERRISKLTPLARKDDDANMQLFRAKSRLKKKQEKYNQLMKESVELGEAALLENLSAWRDAGIDADVAKKVLKGYVYSNEPTFEPVTRPKASEVASGDLFAGKDSSGNSVVVFKKPYEGMYMSGKPYYVRVGKDGAAKTDSIQKAFSGLKGPYVKLGKTKYSFDAGNTRKSTGGQSVDQAKAQWGRDPLAGQTPMPGWATYMNKTFMPKLKPKLDSLVDEIFANLRKLPKDLDRYNRKAGSGWMRSPSQREDAVKLASAIETIAEKGFSDKTMEDYLHSMGKRSGGFGSYYTNEKNFKQAMAEPMGRQKFAKFLLASAKDLHDEVMDMVRNASDAGKAEKKLQGESVKGSGIEEATDFRKGDTVFQVGSKLKGTVQHKGNRDLIAVKFGTINQMIPASKLRLAEEVELDEAKGAGVKKFVRGMRVQNLNGSKGSVIKGGDNMKKAVEVEWDNGQTTLASAKYLKSIKKNESVELDEAMGPLSKQQIDQLKKAYGSIDKINVTGPAYKKMKKWVASLDKEDLITLAKAKVKWVSQFAANELRLTHNIKLPAKDWFVEGVELGEAKISVGDRVTLQPNKNTLDRSLIGKAGVVAGMVGSKPTVKFANGKTIAVSPKDLKINESVELDEATYMVTIDKGTYGGVKSDGQPILVKAKSVRDATTKAAKKVKIDPRLVPTGGFDVKVNNKESVEHENCGTPDCCGTCDTDIKEMNFFQFRNRINEARKDSAADLYFNTYSAAVQYAKAQAEKKGYEVDEDDWQDQVASGPRKPSKDKTVRHTLKLTKNGKPVRQGLSIQVYNRGSDKNPYELNYYVS